MRCTTTTRAAILLPLRATASSPSPPKIIAASHCYFSTDSSTQSQSQSHRPSCHDEKSRNVRVSVWWDFQNCGLPPGANAFKVSSSITAAVRANGIKGPIQITAFGDVLLLPRLNQEALSSTGVNLAHIPAGGKSSADRSLLVDLMCWTSKNPPPAHIFLISGDGDFASILHRLRMNNYNILLASLDSAPSVLCSAASIMWPWNALVSGENLTGKHFNIPPDGPYNSWYGHHKVPVEDPYLVSQKLPCPSAEILSDPVSDFKPLPPIPEEVVAQIRSILSWYPEGVSITVLRAELGKLNLFLGKDLYGHKKFVRLLLSMPHILKLQFHGSGNYFVHGLTSRDSDVVKFVPHTAAENYSKNGVDNSSISSTTKSLDKNSELSAPSLVHKSVDENLESSHSHEHKVLVEPLPNVPKASSPDNEVSNASCALAPDVHLPPAGEQDCEPPSKSLKHCSSDKDDADASCAQASVVHPPSAGELNSASEVGLFRNIWRRWFVFEENGSDKNLSSENTRYESNIAKSTSSPNQVHPAPYTSLSDKSVPDKKATTLSEATGDKSYARDGFFKRIRTWWCCRAACDNLTEHTSEKLSHRNNDSEMHEHFSKGCFWDGVELFLHTPSGAQAVSQSRTREQMAQTLQKKGPPVIASLGKSDVLKLVELLITEKKWVEEVTSKSSPFQLSRSIRKSPLGAQGSTGLSSMFLGKDIQKGAEHDGQKQHQIALGTGVSADSVNRKPLGRSRSKIISDCQKLVYEKLEEGPEGFNMGIFVKEFRERYGYSLDYQKLGYTKLASLFKIFPKVCIVSGYIIPANDAPKNFFPEIPATDNLETIYSNKERATSCDGHRTIGIPKSNQNEVAIGLTSQKGNAALIQNQLDCRNHSLSMNDGFSDMEGESASMAADRGKPSVNEEGGSLLHILDSWYINREDDSGKDCRPDNVDDTVDCSKSGIKSCNPSGVGLKSIAPVAGFGQKQKPYEKCNLVSDRSEKNKDKLIDGILGSLKESSYSKVHA